MDKIKQISIHEYMTMASILEKESTKSDENKLIASVFLNRLAQGMKLQTDPSANYAADKLTGAPTQAELSLNSPYNTLCCNWVAARTYFIYWICVLRSIK